MKRLMRFAATILTCLLLCLVLGTAAARAGDVTLVNDDFEGAWNWTTSGTPTWGITDYRSSSASHSAYCAQSTIPAPGPYSNHMSNRMYQGPFDLSTATAGTVDWDTWFSNASGDGVGWGYSLDGTSWHFTDEGGWSGDVWVHRQVDLSDAPNGSGGYVNLLGQPQVWIAFNFSSDFSYVAEGGYIDNVSMVETVPPTGTMTINNGDTYTNSTGVTIDNSVSYATQMRFRDAGGTWSSWEPYADTKSWTLPAGDGSKTVEAEYQDDASNVLALSDDITLDTVAPTGTMSLNNGADWTTSTGVTIGNSVSGATEMRFRDSGGVWTSWEPYAATKSWTLPTGDGSKTVEAEYRDAALNVLPLSDDITLDTTAPSGAMQLNNGAAATNKLTVTANSAVTGATEMRFKVYNGSSWVYTAWTSYAATATVTIYAPDGTKKVYGYYRDLAGNVFATSDTIVLDRVAPSGSMQLNAGAAATNKLTVTANSAVTGAKEMRFRAYDGAHWVYSAWTAYAGKATVTIYAPDGTKRVYGYYRDAAGNVFSTSDTIVLDRVAPSGTMQLNHGAATTSSTTVTANSSITGATEMRFASYDGATKVYTAWQPYAATATVTLYAPDGTKKVYGYYRDAAGNLFTTSDTIVLNMR